MSKYSTVLTFGIVIANDQLHSNWLHSNAVCAIAMQTELDRGKICDLSFLFVSKEIQVLSTNRFMIIKLNILCPILQRVSPFFLHISADSFAILILAVRFIENILVLVPNWEEVLSEMNAQ